MNLIDIDKIFPNLIEGANTDELRNGKVLNGASCWNDCCGCADCGEHEHTFQLDKDSELNISWNNWRNYTNHLEIRCMNHEKRYQDQVLYMETSCDVTSRKNFWLSEEDRKFLFHIMIRAILYLKDMKTEPDINQTNLEDYL